MSLYKKNKNWNMMKEEGKLYISKGADEMYYLDEVKDDCAERIFNAYQYDGWDNLTADNAYNNVIRKLEQAGVIYKEWFRAEKTLQVSIQFLGMANEKLIKALQKICLENASLTDNSADCDLLLLVRTNLPLKQILENYDSIQSPHLFVDLAYAHTLSIGPLVHTHHTACLSCFIGRLTRNWGDPPPPEEPYMTSKTDLIAALLQERIKEYAECGNCPDLINNAWSFNTKKFTATYDKVHKLPWCPVCGKRRENGAFDLPWDGDGL